MILPFLTTSKPKHLGANIMPGMVKSVTFLAPFAFAVSCTSTQQVQRQSVTEGSISYPFIAETRALGYSKTKQPFVVRSAVGAREYTVEIPDNAARYDIQIPLAELSSDKSGDLIGLSSPGGGAKGSNPSNTDKELVSALPDLGKAKGVKAELMDTAFGVGRPDGPIQSPSYTLGIARVNQHFKDRNFEIALVELNNLLAFYPNSPKLLKMKGTLLVKTGNRELGMKAWQRALDLTPNDIALRTSIHRLNERILADRASASSINSSTVGDQPAANDQDAILDKAAPAH